MTKDLIIIIIALFVAVLPFLGFPGAWKTALYGISGLAIVVLTLLLRRDFLMRLTQKRKKQNGDNGYVENGDISAPSQSSNYTAVQKEEGVAGKRITVRNTESSNT